MNPDRKRKVDIEVVVVVGEEEEVVEVDNKVREYLWDILDL